MATRGKKYLEARGKVDRNKRYELEEGVKLLLETAYAKFDEGVDLAIRLGVDPKKADLSCGLSLSVAGSVSPLLSEYTGDSQ